MMHDLFLSEKMCFEHVDVDNFENYENRAYT